MASQTKRMHTVPEGYLRAFADRSARYQTPHVWRFERTAPEARLLGIRDISVSRKIYMLWSENAQPSTFIEKELLADTIESGFPELVASLNSDKWPSGWGWRRLSRFMAFQLVRTERAFQFLRDAGAAQDMEIDRNAPQLAMAYIAPKIENWICQLSWLVLRNNTEFPILTSDNPVTTWADIGDGFEVGVGFRDPGLRLLFPLSPKICIACIQTPASLKAISADTAESDGSFCNEYELSVGAGTLTFNALLKHNQVTLANAERYAYSDHKSENLQLFMADWFVGRSGPVRRDDR